MDYVGFFYLDKRVWNALRLTGKEPDVARWLIQLRLSKKAELTALKEGKWLTVALSKMVNDLSFMGIKKKSHAQRILKKLERKKVIEIARRKNRPNLIRFTDQGHNLVQPYVDMKGKKLTRPKVSRKKEGYIHPDIRKDFPDLF